ncbi:DUF5667 domain-containing protein [Chloroflexota bacterium]
MMKKTKEFDNILDDCLERILANGETIEQCLASYPEQAAELEPLLKTVLLTREATRVKPRREFRERARYQFQAAIREAEEKRARGFFNFGWQPRWATAVVVSVIVLLSGTGTVAAASNSMPDSPLYPVKLASEKVQLALTPSNFGKAELYVKLADKRVAEIVRMADKGKAEQVEKLAERLNGHLVAMVNLAAPQRQEMAVLQVPAPQPAPQMAQAPQVEEEEALQETEEEAQRDAEKEAPGLAMRGASKAAPGPATKDAAPKAAQRVAPVKPAEAIKGAGGGGDGEEDMEEVGKRARLITILSNRALENPAALQAILEKAPESVKSALLRAIALSDEAYRQALEALE